MLIFLRLEELLGEVLGAIALERGTRAFFVRSLAVIVFDAPETSGTVLLQLHLPQRMKLTVVLCAA